MKIKPIIDHLQAGSLDYLDIHGVADLGVIEDRLPRSPALFIVATEETPLNGRETGPVLKQRLRFTFSAVTVIRDVSGATSRAGIDALTDLRTPMIARMATLDHPDTTNKPIPAGARLVSFENRILIFEDSFTVDGVRTINLN